METAEGVGHERVGPVEGGEGGVVNGVVNSQEENGMEIDNAMEQESDQMKQSPVVEEGEPPVVTEGGEPTVTEEGGGDKLSEKEIKHWAAVKENPADFNSWTLLLQLVEQKGKLGPAREVFDAFLKLYPYCYGYWKKFADLEKKHTGNDTAKEVFERGVAAISLSVDLWVHYINFTIATLKDDPAATEEIRSLYKRAVEACGLEYRSMKLWDAFLQWEQQNKTPGSLLAIYDQLLTIPTLQYQRYFDSFKQLAESTPPSELLSTEEYEELLSAAQREGGGEEGEQDEGALQEAVRQKVIEKRTAIHERCKEEVEKRAHFEEGIKRPYFHVKPLERAQLKNWKEYLDFEIAQGNQQRVLVLFERCMVACALYEDFWTKFAKYAEDHCPEYAESVYSRACSIHLQQKPNIHVAWAAYEEKRGNVEKAREVLAGIDSLVPGLVLVRLRRVGLEVRQQCYDRAETLYQESVSSAQTTEARNFYAWRYARFAAKVLGDYNKAATVLREAIAQDRLNPSLYLRLLDIETSRHPVQEIAVEDIFRMVEGSTLPEDVKQSFTLRRLQFLEEFGSSITKLLSVQEECQKLRRVGTGGRKRSTEDPESPTKRVRLDSEATTPDGSSAQPQPQPQTAAVTGDQQPMLDQQAQWTAYQQQWGAYNYGQQGYNYQQYYPYSYGQQSQQ